MERLDEKPSAEIRTTGKTTSINGLFLSLLGIIIILGLLIAGFTFLSQSQTNSSLSEKHARHVTALLAGKIAEIAAGYQQYVKVMSANTEAADLLNNEDKAGLDELATKLQILSPNIIKIRFLPKEHNETDTDPLVPLTFSSLDLARRTESSGQVPAVEVHAPNSPSQHIALASAVRDDSGDIVGVLHMAVRSEAIIDAVKSMQEDAASVALLQVSGQESIELARSPAYKGETSNDQTISIPNSIWTLAYQPVSMVSFMNNILPALAILAGTLFSALLVFLKKMRLRKAIMQDQQSIIRLVENKLGGKHENLLGNYLLQDNKDLIKHLSQVAVTASGKDMHQAHAEHAEGMPAFPSQVTQTESTVTDVEDLQGTDIEAEIFRKYDIRGVVGDTLNLEHAYVIGKAIGSLAIEKGEFDMLVARDGRISSKDLASTLMRGLVETGINVIDLGLMPTPVLYFGTNFLSAKSGVMVTGSHNPPEYNGFKIVIGGEALKEEELQALYQRIQTGQFSQGQGSKDQQDISADYIQRIADDAQLLKPLKVVIDCGHGAASVVARALFETLGCDVLTLYCEVDGKFPAHHPDPGDPKNIVELAETVKAEGADIGIAFDGDGDRLGVVDSSGKQIMPDRVLMLLAAEVLLRNPGADILYDVKSTKHLASHILSSGGRPIMWKSGHSLMKAKMKETGALLGGEFSGHIFFTERWYGFDDALYAAARLLEVISGDGRYSSEIFAELPDSINTKELSVNVAEGVQYEVMEKLQQATEKAFPNAKVVDIDGIRAEYPGAWGLIRASNTTPALVLRFEADNEEALEKVQNIFRTVLSALLPKANIPF